MYNDFPNRSDNCRRSPSATNVALVPLLVQWLHSSCIFLLLAACVGALPLIAAPATAQEPVTDDDVNDVARDLYCPVCENTPLDACPTQACQDWRDEIRAQLSQGRSEHEIQQYFVDRYGVEVLAQPPFEGFNMLIWLLPILVVVLAAFLFWRYLGRLREGAPPTADEPKKDDTAMVAQGSAQQPPPAADEDDYVSRIEKEVRE